MLKITIIELLFRAIPESFLFIWTSYIFAHLSIEKKKYFISSILSAVSIYLIRLLPINIGVNIIITSAVYIIITASINKIPIMKAISSIMISSILLSICESLNVFVLNWLKVDMQIIVDKPLIKILYFTPSLMLFGSIVLLLYIKVQKEGR
jgi:hypothetical protein